MKKVSILNCDFGAVTLQQTVDWAADRIQSGKHDATICTVNVAILMMMRSNRRLQDFVDDATLVVADGTPLVWASRMQQSALPERVAGVDLVDSLCALAAAKGFGVYFLGAGDEVIEAAVDNLKRRHPRLIVSGFSNGFFDDTEAGQRAEQVRESGADLLFVGMGVPRQERFLLRHREQMQVSLAVPVGGSFEVVAGTAKRAPVFLQRAGLEWAFRLAQEPRRLWKRYLVTNSQFLFHIARDARRSRSK